MPDSPIKMQNTEFFPASSPRMKTEAELTREKNIKARDAFLAQFLEEPEFAEAMEALNYFDKPKQGTNSAKKFKNKRSKGRDSTFRSSCLIPKEKRKSARLQNKSPIFTEEDLHDEVSLKRKHGNDCYDDLEDIVYQPKKPRFKIKNLEKQADRYCPPIEDVTEDMINNVARKVSIKVYSGNGTSCHQCRQKTLDQKTICRSSQCIGVRGQFCGVCLENRYGEDASATLRDSNWHCPVCRGICNCSFCRAKAGKRPTGILTPLAQSSGHKCVKDFLQSLHGEGDYVHEDNLWQDFKNPENLLGFSKENIAQMGGKDEVTFECSLSSDKFMNFFKKELENFELFLKTRGIENYLLGFDKDLNAIMSSGYSYKIDFSPGFDIIKAVTNDFYDLSK